MLTPVKEPVLKDGHLCHQFAKSFFLLRLWMFWWLFRSGCWFHLHLGMTVGIFETLGIVALRNYDFGR